MTAIEVDIRVSQVSVDHEAFCNKCSTIMSVVTRKPMSGAWDDGARKRR
jgi:hypothetical protein